MIETILNKIYKKIQNNVRLERNLRLVINRILDFLENIFYPYPKNALEIKSKKIKNILLWEVGSTGDIAVFSSFTAYLKTIYPKSKITSLILKKESIKYVASLDKNIDEIIAVDLPRFFTYSFISKVKKKFNYDLFIMLNLYPNLRYLMPNIKFIHMPYFIFRDIPVNNIPRPQLKMDFNVRKNNSIFINFDTITFNFSSNYLTNKEIEEVLLFLLKKFKQIKFIVNDFENRIILKKENLQLFKGNYKSLLKEAVSAKIIISMRNGLCDVVAASTKDSKIFIIYPDDSYPGKNGVDFSRIFGMKEIDYPSKIIEYVFNKKIDKNLTKLKNKISNFINSYYYEK